MRNNRYKVSGTRAACKKCTKISYALNRKDRKPKLGIDKLSQIDSAVREMAELQHQIDTENKLCEQRVAMVREYTQEITKPLCAHQIRLRQLIVDFLRLKHKVGHTFKKNTRFGTVHYNRGKIKIRLNSKLAGQRMGKP